MDAAKSPFFGFTATSAVRDGLQEFLATGDAADRIVRKVEVHPDGREEAATAAAILSKGSTVLTINLPDDTVPGSTDAWIKVYPNLGARLRDALTTMSVFPDGCTEQVLSLAWPSFLLQQHAAALPGENHELLESTRKHLQEAYGNGLGSQRSDGGFGYWPRSVESDTALTAYVVRFMTEASPYIAVDAEVTKRALAYLKSRQTSGGPRRGFWIVKDAGGHWLSNDVRANTM